jgi:hypothetical protein
MCVVMVAGLAQLLGWADMAWIALCRAELACACLLPGCACTAPPTHRNQCLVVLDLLGLGLFHLFLLLCLGILVLFLLGLAQFLIDFVRLRHLFIVL